MDQMRHRDYKAKMQAGEGRTFTATITAAVRDREDEVLLPEGMISSDFDKNPVIFWNHDYATPIGKATRLARRGDSWQAEGRMAERPASHPEGAEWFPDTVHSLMQQGIVRGVSVGFRPLSSRNPTKRDKEMFGDSVRRVHNKWDLLEYSVTPLPANQDALISAVSKGLLSAATCKAMFDVDAPTPIPRYTVDVDLRGWHVRAKKRRDDRAAIKQAARTTQTSMARQMGRVYE